MFRSRRLALLLLLAAPAPTALSAQDQGAPPPLPVVDSIDVSGNSRLTAQQVLGTAGLVTGQPTNYRDLQRAIIALFKTGQFDDVSISQVDDSTGKVLLLVKVKERPMLQRWALKGNEQIAGRTAQGEGQAVGWAAAGPRRGRTGPVLDRFDLQGAGLLRRHREDDRDQSGAQPGGDHLRHHRRRPGGDQPGEGGRERQVLRQDPGEAHGHQARGLLLVAEGQVRG